MPRFSKCAVIGMLHGSLAGALLGAMMTANAPATVPLAAIPVAALVLFVIGLSVSLFILVVIERFFLAQVLPATAFNAALVTLIVVAFVSRLPASSFSSFIGWIVGALLGWIIGALLCWLSCRASDSKQ